MPFSFSSYSPFKSPKAKSEPEKTTEPQPKLESILINSVPNPQSQRNEQTEALVSKHPTTHTSNNLLASHAVQIQIYTPLHPKYKWSADPLTASPPSRPLSRSKTMGNAKPDRRKGLHGCTFQCRYCQLSICFWVKREGEARERGKVHEGECAMNPERVLGRGGLGGVGMDNWG
ncbi:hypothetical protein EG328_000065 [Venturia inaequalis]|uniref:Uncharacterized protein n=1 Tax=Venturia inaequalis TaxID=5025 RepID=A0A8H3VLQ1_VENIN|nr:hypothetical protein EG328_000065 [Venturia inaequalis]RDI89598.1 hypothetical protein Vi05172_g30 [Venturia inaequalis]